MKKSKRKTKKNHVNLTMKKNIKCNEINRSKIVSKRFEKKRNKNQSIFDEKKSLETISLKQLEGVLSNKRQENATFSWQH
jgi:hypothetical protein